MPISDSTSEKHFRTRTAAATEDRRELLDESTSLVMSLNFAGLELFANRFVHEWVLNWLFALR